MADTSTALGMGSGRLLQSRAEQFRVLQSSLKHCRAAQSLAGAGVDIVAGSAAGSRGSTVDAWGKEVLQGVAFGWVLMQEKDVQGVPSPQYSLTS